MRYGLVEDRGSHEQLVQNGAYDRKRTISSATEPVDGIGDQAYWQPDIASLHVLGGDTHIFVAFAGSSTPDGAKEKAISLARLVLPRAKAKL